MKVPLLAFLCVYGSVAFSNPLLTGRTTKTNAQLDIYPIAAEDQDDFVRIMADPSVLEQANARLTPEEAAEWFKEMVKSPSKPGNGHESSPGLIGFTLRDPAKAGKIIGFVVLEEKPSGYWETSTGIAEGYRSGGIGTLARELITAYVFTTMRA